MSARDVKTSKQLLQHFFSQDNTLRSHHRGVKHSKPDICAELQQIKDEYEVLKRKNREEIELIRKIENGATPMPELGTFVTVGGSRETVKNFQILINNEFSGSVESKRSRSSSTAGNGEISFMKEFVSITEIFKNETGKLADQGKRLRQERDALKRKLDEYKEVFEAQNSLLQELQENNSSLKLKLSQTNKEVEKEIRSFITDAETEKRRYLGSLKKLIEIFQIEKLRIEETFSTLSCDITTEKTQHFQDVEQLKQVIDQLREEIKKNQMLYHTGTPPLDFQNKRPFQVFQEIEEYRKYAHELELIIQNLGHDIKNLENENSDLKKQNEQDFQLLKAEADSTDLQLREQIEMCKQQIEALQEIKVENEYILEENEALKNNLEKNEEKHNWRVQTLNKELREKQLSLSFQAEHFAKTIEKLNAEQTTLQETITALQIELDEKSAEIKKLEVSKQELEIVNTLLKNDLENGQQMVEQTKTQQKELSTKLMLLHDAETKELKAKLSKLEKEAAEYQTGMIEQETLYKILKVDFDEFLFERNSLMDKFSQEKQKMTDNFEEKVRDLKSQIQELQSTNDNFEQIEKDLHQQIQGLVHNINVLSEENKKEVEGLRHEAAHQIAQELEVLKRTKNILEEQISQCEKENLFFKTDLQYKEQKISNLDDELKNVKTSFREMAQLLEDTKDHYENELLQMKLSNERSAKRSKDEIERLYKEFEQQSLFCDHLDKRKKELERLNTKYADNLEQVTKTYERELKDLRLELQNTKSFYDNKLSYQKNEALFEAKKFENRVREVEQELKLVKYEAQWFRENHKQ